MSCPQCGYSKGWDCICEQHQCPCGAWYSDDQMQPDHPDLCPTCAEGVRYYERKGERVTIQ